MKSMLKKLFSRARGYSLQWYKPWRELRPGPGSDLPTDYQYTGQRDAGWGLAHFGARWLDSNLGRFAQADTVIPGAMWVNMSGAFTCV